MSDRKVHVLEQPLRTAVGGQSSMKPWSLGRVDFGLPEQYRLRGRNQSIYHIEFELVPYENDNINEIRNRLVDEARKSHLDSGNAHETFKTGEISPGFQLTFYRANATIPELVTAEALKQVPGYLLKLKSSRKAGKEQVVTRLMSLMADDYRPEIGTGFNVGAGSLISQPSINESAYASFEDPGSGLELVVRTSTAGKTSNPPPAANFTEEAIGLRAEGIQLKLRKQDNRGVMGFPGEESLITLKDPNQKQNKFRYTWFYPGETADALKPEVLVNLTGSLDKLEQATTNWNGILESMRMRQP